MTIEFPRPFPDGVYVATTQFDCREIIRTSPLGNGGRESVNQWAARWRGAWRTQWLAGEQLGAMQAWLSSQRNGGRSFLGRETGRAALAGHVSGLGGSPAITAITALDDIAIEGLPADTALKAGDLFSVSQIVSTVNWRALCRVEEDATADGSGDLASLKFSPPLPAGIFTTAAELHFAAPSALMKLTPGSVAEEQFGAHLRYAFAGEQIWGVAIPPVTGALAASYDPGYAFAGAGSVVVSGALAAGYDPAYAFAGDGVLAVSGSMAAEYDPLYVFAGSGVLAVSGVMAAGYDPGYVFDASGIVGNPVIGTLAADYAPGYAFAGAGAVTVSGALAADYAPGYAFDGSGAVLVSGALAAGYDPGYVFAGDGTVAGTTLTLTRVGVSESIGATIDLPAGAAEGDWALFFDSAVAFAGAPGSVVPASLALVSGLGFVGSNERSQVSHGFLSSGDISAGSLTGMAVTDENLKLLLVLRPSVACTVSAQDVDLEATTGDPAAQVILSGSSTGDATVPVGFALETVSGSISFTTDSPASDEVITHSSTAMVIGYNIYDEGDTPVNKTVDVADVTFTGESLRSAYFRFIKT